MKAVFTNGMIPIYIEFALMDCKEEVSLWLRPFKLWKDAMPRHMEGIMGYFGHMPRFGKVAFSGQQCIKIQKSLSGDAIDAKNMGASTHEMPCHLQTISMLNSLMYAGLISWGHSLNPKIMSTS